MTVRRALVTKDSEAIKEYTNAERDSIHQYLAKKYADDPSVYLSYSAADGGNLGTFTDHRFRSGPAATSTGNQDAVDGGAAEYPQEADTGEPEEIAVQSYTRMVQTRTNPNVGFTTTWPNGWTAKPVYMETDSIVREMTFQDMLDTFIDPVIGNIVSGTTANNAGGSFFISTSDSETNSTQLGLVFRDTVTANSLYDAASIDTAGTYQSYEDTNSRVNYYLHRNDGVTATRRLPLVIDYTSNGRNNPAGLREMTSTEFDNLFVAAVKQQAFDGSGNTLEYNINGSGTTKGSAITDRSMTSVTGDYQTLFVGVDDYRAQEFPDGTISVKQTWRLKLGRT